MDNGEHLTHSLINPVKGGTKKVARGSATVDECELEPASDGRDGE